jgi:hypothetical protein
MAGPSTIHALMELEKVQILMKVYMMKILRRLVWTMMTI